MLLRKSSLSPALAGLPWFPQGSHEARQRVRCEEQAPSLSSPQGKVYPVKVSRKLSKISKISARDRKVWLEDTSGKEIAPSFFGIKDVG
jgi:hypothetical protein